MYGEHRARRKEKRQMKELKERSAFQKANQEADSINSVQDYQKAQNESMQAAQPGLNDLKNKRKEHLQESINEVSTPVKGLSDFERRQLQETASNQIGKDTQNYSRQLASSAGKRGVRGGSAQAQQLALQDRALDARRQFERDIGEKDIDIAMQKLGAALASTEGKQAQEIGAQAEARDYMEAQREKKRQQALAKIYNNQYLQR
jgi:hypothetical protein